MSTKTLASTDEYGNNRSFAVLLFSPGAESALRGAVLYDGQYTQWLDMVPGFSGSDLSDVNYMGDPEQALTDVLGFLEDIVDDPILDRIVITNTPNYARTWLSQLRPKLTLLPTLVWTAAEQRAYNLGRIRTEIERLTDGC